MNRTETIQKIISGWNVFCKQINWWASFLDCDGITFMNEFTKDLLTLEESENIPELCEIAYIIGRKKNSDLETMDGGYFEFESFEGALEFYKYLHKKWSEYEGPVHYLGEFIHSMDLKEEFRNFNS